MKYKYTILVIDDDNILRKLYKLTLEKQGFKVHDAPNANKNFIETVINLRPDLISHDVINSPNGFTVLKLLKSNDQTKNIPFFFLTNNDNDEQVKQAKKLGAAGYLVNSKITPKELADTYIDFLMSKRNRFICQNKNEKYMKKITSLLKI
ncbi:MAG: response regulator [Candidatus Jacksonbacteria bacterium]